VKKTLTLAAAIALLGIMIYTIIQYRIWVEQTETHLEAGSQLAQTELGPVEYASLGEGPAVVVLHGLKGGYDQGLVTVHLLDAPEFQMISISRPGYLQTPLSSGRTLEGQADAIAALLDALQIESAAVIAQSAGGPYALQFALRHPDRCWGVVLVSAITMPKEATTPGLVEKLLSLLVDRDFGNWLMIGMANRWPDQMIPLLIPDPEHLDLVLADPQKLESLLEGAQSLALSSRRAAGSENDVQQITTMSPLPLQEISVPALVIAGTGDDLTEDAEYFASQNSTVELVLVVGGDHSTFTVYSDTLVPQVIDFLQSNAPGQ
jgi:pimeloyl-ACP methyl ester carboxylesterase